VRLDCVFVFFLGCSLQISLLVVTFFTTMYIYIITMM
jgi:hypothetical protein